MFAFDATTNVPKTGDAANITAYVSKDYGTVTVLGDTSATEMDATNAPGYYLFDAAQAETNADCLMVSGKSSTSNIKIIGAPAVIYTRPTTGWLAPATAGRTLVVDASGLADANMVKAGPTGSGTAITARDIGASVLLSAGTGTGQLDFTSGVVKANATQWLGGTIPAVNVTGVPLVDLKYTLGTLSAGAAGSVRADAVTGAVGSVTGAVGSVTGLTAANLDAAVSTRLASASYTAPPSTASITAAVLTTQMTESYAALHAAPTLAQALFETRGLLAEKSIAGTTMTVNKIDGSTPAETYTLNDATSPTAITRAT